MNFQKIIITTKKKIVEPKLTNTNNGQCGPIIINGFPLSSPKNVCVLPNFE